MDDVNPFKQAPVTFYIKFTFKFKFKGHTFERSQETNHPNGCSIRTIVFYILAKLKTRVEKEKLSIKNSP